MKTENVDVLVIGAGPSGAVAAAILEKNGINLKVVEREKFPRFVIGESLIPRCMDNFDEAGFIEGILEKGFEKKLSARFLRGEEVCHFDFSQKYTKGWDWTWQMPRAEFDKTLTDILQSRGVDIEFETTVENVIFNGSDSVTTVSNAKGTKEIHAKFIIDSSGYGRVLPRLFDLDAPSSLDPMSAIFVHLKDNRRPKGVEGTQITFDVLSQKNWFWVIPFSENISSLGLVAPKEYLESVDKGDNAETFREIIRQSDYYRERFDGLEFLFEPKKLVAYSSAVKKLYGPGYALTGNSAEFLDPVFSSGVCFASESGATAARLISKQLKGESVDWEKEYEEYIMEGVGVFRSYVKTWYTGELQRLFFHPEVNEDIKSKLCSVLAGYVWDKTNPFVSKHDRAVQAIAHVLT